MAVCLTGAAVSWACTTQANIALSAVGGAPGTPVSVSGTEFAAGAVVSIRWNSATGPVLATATASPQGTFSTSIAIPNVAPGPYVVVARAPEGMGTAAFTIVGPPRAPAAGASPHPANQITSGGGQASRGGANSLSASGGETSPSADDRSSGSSRRPAQDSAVAVTDSGSRTPVYTDSAGPATPAAAGAPKAKPSERTAAAGLWGGFASPKSGILADSPESPGTGGSLPAFSIALLALGLAAGLGGLALVGARRRARASTRG